MKDRKKNNIRNIVLFIILIILIVLINYTKSDAQEWANLTNMINWGKVGDTVPISYNTLADDDKNNKDNLYCVQHNAAIGSSTQYGMIYKIRIEGNKATSSHMDTNGQYLTSNTTYNGMLAYILGGGNRSYGYGTKSAKTDRQKELWSFWNKWIQNSGYTLGVDWYWTGNDSVSGVSTLEQEAKNYAENNSTASIVSNVGTSIDTESTYAGPFNVTYTGQISSIQVIDTNGQIIEGGYEFRGDNNVYISNYKGIASGQNFYINNWSGKIIREVKIDVGVSNEVINLDILLLKSSKTGNQKLIFTRPEKVSNPISASVTIGVSSPNNVLRVVKHRAENESIKQIGVGFIINKEGTGYLRYNNTGIVETGKMEFNSNFTWVENRDSATIFKTVNTDDGWTGYFQISGIPTGKYYIGEVYNSNEGYEESTLTKAVLEKYKEDQLIKTDAINNIQKNNNLTGYVDNKLQVVSVNLENDGYTKVLRVYDKKQPGKEEPETFKITISKTSATSSTTKLSAQFKIKVLDGKKAIGWLTGTGNTHTYTSSYTNADKYTTTNGVREINNLDPDYKYEIYEVSQPSGYYSLSNQIIKTTKGGISSSGMTVKIDGESVDDIEYIKKSTTSNANNDYAATTDSIYCGTVSYNRNGSNVKVSVTNRKSSGGGGRRR